MANKEISPPGGDLGVGTTGRSGLVNALTTAMWWDRFNGDRRGRRGGVSFGGGRSKRQMKNDMAMMEYQYRLQDELERARTARGVEGSAQTDANAYQAADAFFGGGTIEGVSGAHTPKQIQNVEARPKKGNFKGAGGTSAGWEYADEQLGGEEPQADEDPDVTDDPPIEDGPTGDAPTPTPTPTPRAKRRTAADARAEMQLLMDTYGDDDSAHDDDTWTEYTSRMSALADEHDILSRDATRKANNRAKKRVGSSGVAPIIPEHIPGARILKNTPKALREQTAYALEETAGIVPSKEVGTVNEDASIDTGEVGNRPAPGGKNGVSKGQQFNQ